MCLLFFVHALQLHAFPDIGNQSPCGVTERSRGASYLRYNGEQDRSSCNKRFVLRRQYWITNRNINRLVVYCRYAGKRALTFRAKAIRQSETKNE